MMTKTYLEDIIAETNQKLNEGITIFIKDHRKGDAIISGLISGVAFAVGSIAINEIRNSVIRHKNKKWYKSYKETES